MAAQTQLHESHPNPQFRRPAWVDLRGPWAFAIDDENVGLTRCWARDATAFSQEICVPFPPESTLSGIADPGPHQVVWYRRTLQFERPKSGHRVVVHFGAVDYAARVWVNGEFVGEHQGGNSSFSLDITAALAAGSEQVLVVRAEDSSTDLTQPRGKQSWEPEPSRIWYGRTTGIWQPVWLEVVPETHLAEIRWTPTSEARIDLVARLTREPRNGDQLRVRLSRSGTSVVNDVYTLTSPHLERSLALEPAVLEIGRERLLWEPDHPNLLDSRVTLEDSTGHVLDQVDGYVGMRTVSCEDGLFLLNGIPTYLRFVLSQGYWPDSHLAAPSDANLRAEVEWVKRLGFNGLRLHQKVEDPRFLYWCDRLGVMAWSEMASAYQFSDLAIERFVREWLEVMRRDHSHPSIVTWLPFNESWGIPHISTDPAQRNLVAAVYRLTKALDPSRPALGNDGWEHVAGDVLGIHDYATEGATLRERYGTREALAATLERVRPQFRRLALPNVRWTTQPVMLTEFGGVSYEPGSGQEWYGYGTVRDATGFLATYEDLVAAVLDSPALAGFCYTQLTDTEQETNGLLTAAREPKVDVAELNRITRRPSRAVPGDRTTGRRTAVVSDQRREKL
jgi:beta-galactosidase/beta-glucuronidase